MSESNAGPEDVSADWFTFDSLPSTNDKALELAQKGAPSGAVVTTSHQTDGRGRRGRSWFCPEGSLALSVIHRPSRAIDELASITPCIAVALVQAMDALGIQTTIKWPNDLLIDGLKVAGILCELHQLSDGPVVIVGVGLNVNVRKFPAEVADIATSLALHGGARKLDAVADGVATEVRIALASHDAGGEVPALFGERLGGVGSPVTLSPPDGLSGILLGVRLTDGALQVRDAAGVERFVTSGEIA